MKRLDSIRIQLPGGEIQQALELAAKLHGAPALSQYVLTAALNYSKAFLEKAAKDIEERKQNDNK